jgi:hypothetical protein
LETADADGLSVAEIMTATGSQHRNAMDKLLFRMVADGEVERMRRRGLYRLPQDKPGHPDPSSTGKISQKVRSEQKPSYFQKDGLSTNTADLTGKIDSQIERDAEALISRENPARSDFLTDLTAPGAFRPPEPTVDPWEHPDLAGGVPDYLLVRNRPRLGPPAISAGPDDDLGDLK